MFMLQCVLVLTLLWRILCQDVYHPHVSVYWFDIHTSIGRCASTKKAGNVRCILCRGQFGFDYEVPVMPLDALRGALLYEANSHSKWTNRCLVSYSGCIARALLYEYVIRAHVSKIYVGVMNAS